ncbi:FtsX-like permease family protein [Streptomyces arenae]|uniref:FtsX-like permease family protein n=1 Tax=Streptomyces arenae TaxID=29301 RepID=UPI00265987CC|nr:FtsX family ABC transporter permease [Streptomyces arenae]MCG7208185.1 ABC transporter permease [Streptomyces arenae]
MLHFALRMAAHRITALLAVACAVLGAAALVTATGVLAESGLRSRLPPGRLGGADVVVAADQEYHVPGDLPIALPERASVPAALTGRLARLPGVTAAVGDLGFPAAVTDPHGRLVPVADQDPATAGHGWSSTRLLSDPRIEGRAPTAPAEAAVDASTGLSVGDHVHITANGRPPAPYRITALVHAPDAGIYVTDTRASQLANRVGETTTVSPRAGTVDLVGLRVAPGAGERVAAEVRAAVAGSGLKVLTGADRGTAVAPGVGSARSLLVLLAGSLAGIVLLITGFVTAGALGVAIAGQRRDLALMRAVGATPRQIRRLAAAQSTAVATVALVPGVALGYLLAGRFRTLLVHRAVLPAELPLTVGPLPALATVVLLLAVVGLAARCAAWRTSRMPATEAVAESRSEPRTPSRARTVAGLLLMAASCALSVPPLLQRTLLGASATSIAGIVAAIGLALAGPALVRTAGEAVVRRLRPGVSAPTWLALSNVRAYAQRVTGVVSPLAMAVVFVLTYTLAQTTVLAATADDTRTGTPAQYRLTAPALGGLPTGTPAAVRHLPGVEAAAPVGTTTVVWPYRMFGDTETESASALVLTPAAKDVLDPGVTRGSLSALTGATIAVSSEVAGPRDAGPGDRVRLFLGDGAPVTALVVAVYDRGLGFGPVVLSHDLAAGHTTTDLDDSVLVRTDGTARAGRALTALAAARPGLALSDATPEAGADTPPEVWINLAVIVVLLGYLLLSIANRLVAATVQRRTEIAALRLVGTTPGQVLAMMRREAGVIALAALVSGVVLSALPLVLLGQGFLHRPWPAGPVWLLPAAALTVLVTSYATVELPTRRALRVPPAEALRAP